MKRYLIMSTAGILILVPAVFVTLASFNSPSHDRQWSLDQAILPEVVRLDENRFLIHNIRDFRYDGVDNFIPNYYHSEFNLDELEGLSYVVVPFSGYPGAAHTMLSFEFSGERYLSVSVEIRKQLGQQFSALRGMLNHYELMYVLADERDVIKLRTHHRNNDVYLYPVRATKHQLSELFVDIMERVAQIHAHPEFYHSLTNNCTTNIMAHVNQIAPGTLRSFLVGVMPAYSDRYALNRGLLDTDLKDIDSLREVFNVSAIARNVEDFDEFSSVIRQQRVWASQTAH